MGTYSPNAVVRESAEEFCPTCGISLKLDLEALTRQAERPSPIVWPWLLIIFGIFLIATSMPDMLSFNQKIQATREPLVNNIPPNLAPALATESQNDLNPTLALLAVGGILIMAGVSIKVRPRVERQLRVSPSGSHSCFQTILGLWAVGETVLVSGAVITLVMAGYIIAKHLMAGTPPSWTLLEETRIHLRQIVAAMIALAKAEPGLPAGWTT